MLMLTPDHVSKSESILVQELRPVKNSTQDLHRGLFRSSNYSLEVQEG
jgi:hypothetical protein